MVCGLSDGGKRIRTFGPAALRADPISAVCDHDFAEMPPAFEMAVCLLRLGKRERPIDHGAQAVHRNCPAAKSTQLPTLIALSVIPRPVSNKGSRPAPDFERLAPIRLRCPPTAKAFSDIAIVPGPPISTTQSTPRALVSSRTFSSQFGVSVS